MNDSAINRSSYNQGQTGGDFSRNVKVSPTLDGETSGTNRLPPLRKSPTGSDETAPYVVVVPSKKNKVGANDGSENTSFNQERDSKRNSSGKAKRIVFIRIVFMKLGEIDTVKETFSADVFIQARWREPELDGKENASKWGGKPITSDKYGDPKVVIDNAVGDPKEVISTIVDYPDKNVWQAYIVERRRVKGTFLENFELFQFPFDTQDLTVTVISELPDSEIQLEDDPEQFSTINTEMFVDEQEWRLYNEVEVVKDNVVKFYQLDTLDNKSHSLLSCRTHASRRPGFYIYSVFLIMCFICSMTFCTFSVDLNKRENRLQLTFILLLTTVTFKFAVNSSLPRISYLTTLDVYILSSSVVLISVCIWHAIVIPIQSSYGALEAAVADKAVLIALGSIYLLEHVIFVIWVTIRTIRRNRMYEELEDKHMKMVKKEKKTHQTKHTAIRKAVNQKTKTSSAV